MAKIREEGFFVNIISLAKKESEKRLPTLKTSNL
jgi:hypothetical protein